MVATYSCWEIKAANPEYSNPKVQQVAAERWRNLPAAEKQPFGNKGFVSLYTISYRMCSNAGSMDHSEALYERANRAIGRYLEDHVSRFPDLDYRKEDLR